MGGSGIHPILSNTTQEEEKKWNVGPTGQYLVSIHFLRGSCMKRFDTV